MEYRESTSRWLPALGVSLIWLACSEVAAKDLPEGIPVGPWFLAPTVSTSYTADNNIFLDSPDQDPTADRITKLSAGLGASLPFRNSRLELGYAVSSEIYEVTVFPNDLAQRGEFDLKLNFKSGDTLSMRETYRQDFARSREIGIGDDIGFPDVQVFEPEPYAINRWEVELRRDEPARQGYLVRVRRQDFVYKGDTDIGFFDYRGFDNVFEYRQPLPNYRRWVLRYNSRRFNHYDSRCHIEGVEECLGGVGVPFRKEISDDFEAGVMGLLGEGQPYVVRLGYSSFRYEGGDSSEYNGIVGFAAWRIRVGGRTDLELKASRRALPSNADTYYVNNVVRAKLTREWLRFETGAEFEYHLNDYADPVRFCLNGVPDGLGLRRDSTYRLDADWGFRVHERFKFEISAFHTNRRSTCDDNDYTGTGIQTGIALGW